ncbi:MAG: hypothetical protein PHT07_23930 [Paludibacter sp.]|nr:hypothetical protein [Paludibacter sp.]
MDINKILLTPIFIMALLVLLGGVTGVTFEPETEILDTELLGEFIEYDPGVGGPYWYYVFPGTGHYYLIEGQGADLFSTFDPSAPENVDKSFRVDNVDTDMYEFYDNYDDFLSVYGDVKEGSGATITNVLDSEELWLLLAGILVASVVLGVAVFGNGLSEWAQRMVFINGGWGAVWLFMSAATSDILLTDSLGSFGPMIYTGLTVTFLIGLIAETSSGGD